MGEVKSKSTIRKADPVCKIFSNILIPILIPVILIFISHGLNERIEKNKDIDMFLEYSSRLEKSYRYIKNYYDELEAGISDYHPSVFREKLASLDFNMNDFYFRTMMLYIPDKSNFKKAIGLMISLYWGKKNIIEQKYSFREFLIKTEVSSRKNRDKFISSMNDTKDVLQYFDNLLHLAILTTSISVHRQGEEVKKGFEQLNDDISNLENKVFSNIQQKINQLKLSIKAFKAGGGA
jgi:hypothetical protein